MNKERRKRRERADRCMMCFSCRKQSAEESSAMWNLTVASGKWANRSRWTVQTCVRIIKNRRKFDEATNTVNRHLASNPRQKNNSHHLERRIVN